MFGPLSAPRKRRPASSSSYLGSPGGNQGLSGAGGTSFRAFATVIARNKGNVISRRKIPANFGVRTLMANSALERDIRAGYFQLMWTCRILRTLAPFNHAIVE